MPEWTTIGLPMRTPKDMDGQLDWGPVRAVVVPSTLGYDDLGTGECCLLRTN